MRIAGIVCALVIAAWCGLSALQAAWLRDARSAVLAQGRPADPEHVQSLLDRARFLRPGIEADLVEGRLRAETGDLEGGLALLARAARSEPDNIAAWDAVAAVAFGRSEAYFRAREELRRLSPLLAAQD